MTKSAAPSATLFSAHAVQLAPIAVPPQLIELVAVDVAVCGALDVVKIADVGSALPLNGLAFPIFCSPRGRIQQLVSAAVEGCRGCCRGCCLRLRRGARGDATIVASIPGAVEKATELAVFVLLPVGIFVAQVAVSVALGGGGGRGGGGEVERAVLQR